MEVIEKTLENGLTIYLSPNQEEPRFYAEIITRAGSKHDPATNTDLLITLNTYFSRGPNRLVRSILKKKNLCSIR